MTIELQNVSIGYSKNNFILNDINITIQSSEILFILGKNGSGKSSLLKGALLGAPFTLGEIYIDGVLLSQQNRSKFLNKVGICLSTGFSYDHLSVEENMEMISAYYPSNEVISKTEIMELFSLTLLKKVKAKQLSSGQRKKLDLAMTFAHLPQLVLLDEPTANIDLESKDEILNLISMFNQKYGVTFLICTHFLEEIEKLKANFIIINEQKIVFSSRGNQELSSQSIKDRYMSHTKLWNTEKL
jgi:ABC-2 type transport system ATP-binding protein